MNRSRSLAQRASFSVSSERPMSFFAPPEAGADDVEDFGEQPTIATAARSETRRTSFMCIPFRLVAESSSDWKVAASNFPMTGRLTANYAKGANEDLDHGFTGMKFPGAGSPGSMD